MPHDGQDIVAAPAVILPDLLALTAAAMGPVDAVLAQAKALLRDLVTAGGKVMPALIDQHQTAAHGLAWLATYVQSLRQMQDWAERLTADGKFGEVEQLLAKLLAGEYAAQLAGGVAMTQVETIRPSDFGVEPPRAELAMSQDEKPIGPLMLQEHGHPVVYRNVWVRKI